MRVTTFAAFRHRNYRLFFVGQLISMMGTWMQQTAIGWLIYQLTGSKLLLGTVQAIGGLPTFFLSTVGGAVADRFPKRAVLVLTQSVMMLAAFALGVLVSTGQIRVWQVAALTAMRGAVMAFDMPVRQAFVVDMVGRDDLMDAVGLNSSLVSGARIVGPAVAGLVMGRFGTAPCFYANAASFLAVIGALVVMRLTPSPRMVSPESVLRHAVGGFVEVRRNPRVLGLMAILLTVGIFGWSYSVLLPVFARDVLGIAEQRYGLLLAANGVGALLGSLVIASLGDYPHWERLVTGGVFLFGVCLVLFSWTTRFHLALLFLALAGLGMISFHSTANTVIQTSVPDAVRGRVMGVWAMVFVGTHPLGSLLAGILAEHFGASLTVSMSASICVLVAVGVSLARKKGNGALRPNVTGSAGTAGQES